MSPTPAPTKSLFFKIIALTLAFMGFLSLMLDIQQFTERNKFEIPAWFLIALLLINLGYFISLSQIWAYRKWAVIVLPLCTLSHFCLMHQYMNTFLYADLFSLFFFITIAMIEIAFNWKKFR